MKKLFFAPILILLLYSCSTRYVVTSMKGEYIPVNAATNPDKKMVDLVDHYKHIMDKEMGQVIGHASEFMDKGKPESLLTNLTSDVMATLDTKYSDGKPIDLAIMNVNGHRSPIAQGNITVGDIFSTYSFENELVVVHIKGSVLKDVFDSFASLGGYGVSGTVKMIIKDKQLKDLKINGLPLDRNKEYIVVTLDYLAEGNDGMKALKKADSVVHTKITLRDYIMSYIKETTREGKDISSKLDGRIIIE